MVIVALNRFAAGTAPVLSANRAQLWTN